MPNKNQANIPIKIKTKEDFDNKIFNIIKEKLPTMTYDTFIEIININSKEILKIFL